MKIEVKNWIRNLMIFNLTLLGAIFILILTLNYLNNIKVEYNQAILKETTIYNIKKIKTHDCYKNNLDESDAIACVKNIDYSHYIH